MWYKKYLKIYDKPYCFDKTLVNEIKNKITGLQSNNPLVTVSVIGYNEEKHLLSCLWTLADMKCKYPIEIIGIDNDSKDKTAEIFKACGVPCYTEYNHSCGFARQCGLNHSKGKYHINIDSDTMYPPRYVEYMVNELTKPNVVGVCSTWSYIPDKKHPWLGLKVYEGLRDIHLYIQSFKRPELAVRGLVFAYQVEYGKKVGIRTDIIRGEDGSLALGLKQYGKIRFIHNRKARAVTGYGTMDTDGSFYNSFKTRIIKYIKGSKTYFSSQAKYKDEDSNRVK